MVITHSGVIAAFVRARACTALERVRRLRKSTHTHTHTHNQVVYNGAPRALGSASCGIGKISRLLRQRRSIVANVITIVRAERVTWPTYPVVDCFAGLVPGSFAVERMSKRSPPLIKRRRHMRFNIARPEAEGKDGVERRRERDIERKVISPPRRSRRDTRTIRSTVEIRSTHRSSR